MNRPVKAENGLSISFFVDYKWEFRHNCNVCGRKYKHARNLERHKKFECTRVKTFGCPYCDYQGFQKVHVNAHMVRRHGYVQSNNKLFQ